MTSMHVVFCKMAVDMLRNAPWTRQQDLVKAWDDTHLSIWSAQIGARQRHRGGPGHPASGKAGCIFSNAMFSMANLCCIAANEAPFPVELDAPFPVEAGVPAEARPAAAGKAGENQNFHYPDSRRSRIRF